MSASSTTNTAVTWHSIRPPPPGYATELILNGQTVKVTVSGKGPSNEQPTTFIVPRALLCAHSEYFNKACEWKERNGEPLETEMPDVQPWVFGVFLAFLFEQRLRKIDIPVHDLEPPAQNAIDGDQTASQGSYHTAEDSLTDIIPWRYQKCPGDCEETPMDPTSWNFTSLFELYIFGDRYAGHLFRQSVFEAIHIRIWLAENHESMYEYLWLDAENDAITYALHCLPDISHLREYLLDLVVSVGYHVQQRGGPAAKARYTKVLETYPRDALARIVIKTGRVTARAKCQKCDAEEECDAGDHEWHEIANPDARGLCCFHEHWTQEERALCSMRYQAMRSKFVAVFIAVLDQDRELAGSE